MTRRVIQTSFDGVSPDEIGYGGKEACAIVGITYRKLDHWDHIDLVKPSLASARGSGTQRTYSYRDLVRLRVVKGLRESGVTLADAKQAIENLRELHGSDWESATIVVAGKKSVLVRDGDELIDLVRNGQSVLNIVPLGPMVGEVDAQIRVIGNRVDQPASQPASQPVSQPAPQSTSL